MSYSATVYNVMIASPSDVARERQCARDVILQWNAIHSEDRKIVLMPIGWETHSSPVTGGRPQGIINRQILETADLLIAVFWARLGSPTGESPSGTVEEIEKHVDAGKPAMVYFSSVPVRLDSVDDAQYSSLKEFRAKLKGTSLYETYESIREFREKLTRQLAQTVIRNLAGDPADADDDDALATPTPTPSLSSEAKQLLIAVSQDSHGYLMMVRSRSGMSVETNGKNFSELGNPRSEAMWEGAIQELCDLALLQERGHRGESFSITSEGYRVADLLRECA